MYRHNLPDVESESLCIIIAVASAVLPRNLMLSFVNRISRLSHGS